MKKNIAGYSFGKDFVKHTVRGKHILDFATLKVNHCVIH